MQSSLPSWLSSHFVPYPWGRNCDSRTHFVLWAFSVEVGALSMMVLRVEDLAVSAPLDFGQANWSAFLKCFTLNSRWIVQGRAENLPSYRCSFDLIGTCWHMLAHSMFSLSMSYSSTIAATYSFLLPLHPPGQIWWDSQFCHRSGKLPRCQSQRGTSPGPTRCHLDRSWHIFTSSPFWHFSDSDNFRYLFFSPRLESIFLGGICLWVFRVRAACSGGADSTKDVQLWWKDVGGIGGRRVYVDCIMWVTGSMG